MFGSILLILMAIFTDAVTWVAHGLGFIAPVNFGFFIVISFLLVQVFVDNIRIKGLIDGLVEMGILKNDNMMCIKKIILEAEVSKEKTGIDVLITINSLSILETSGLFKQFFLDSILPFFFLLLLLCIIFFLKIWCLL